MSSLKSAANSYSIKTVVIDAGHGGKDPGTVGKSSKEKNIALAITLKVKKLLKESSEMNVILTRDSDVFVNLNERAKIANESKADLFISIHCNGVANASPHGNETYVMGQHKSDENLAVAKAENSVIFQEANYQENYEGYDPNDPSFFIKSRLIQQAYLEQSVELATAVQQNFKGNTLRRDRGVKMAGFLVLWKTFMPSVLIEVGFLSNPAEETYLKSEKGQNQIAKSIFDAIQSYSNKYKGEIAEDPHNMRPTNLDIVPDVFNDDSPVFTVQIASSSASEDRKSAPYSSLSNIYEARIDGKYKYFYQTCKSITEVLKLRDEAKDKGFKDAFPVAFYKGKTIKIKKAKELLNIE